LYAEDPFSEYVDVILQHRPELRTECSHRTQTDLEPATATPEISQIQSILEINTIITNIKSEINHAIINIKLEINHIITNIMSEINYTITWTKNILPGSSMNTTPISRV